MGCTSSKVLSDEVASKSDAAELPRNEFAVNEKYVAPNNKRPATATTAATATVMDRHKALTLLDSKIEKDLIKEDSKPIQKALFLGTGEGGKSTVFKQMRLCYGEGFNNFERQQYSKLIWADTLREIRILVDICDEERRCQNGDPLLHELVTDWLGDPELGTDPHSLARYVDLIQSLRLTRQEFLDAEHDVNVRAFLHNHIPGTVQIDGDAADERLAASAVAQEGMPHSGHEPVLSNAMAGKSLKREFLQSSMEQKITTPEGSHRNRAEIAEAVYQLWKFCPPTIKRMVSANQLGMETNAAFFLNKMKELQDPNYLATNDDILHARIKTTGITIAEFQVKSNKLIVMDVGGQRVERKKWIHSFDDVSCVLFVASLSEYDQGLEEEGSVNRLEEALEVFDQTVNSQWFRAKSVQLFLNKTDILNQKCHYSSFSAHFPGYRGNDSNPDEIAQYIESLFRDRFRAGSRNLYVHRTCATDTTTMKFVIDAVSDMVLFENLKWAGMV